ncbi:MAG: tRNA (cytidine(56)-2'-O)-methyltransferase [Infirmifilum sp.]|jgi:tRNA (cytidine56-2'-O)-methyltransferase|uniref:tRNA (cytidine(56)-2'-O)-methyltransferase n=1 Tax=Infirmifilum uzonense TaxID=1550241 RepID=A0A0F7FIA3_9CREN|nr:tRNA (cytidine(56)-2'-O)-methyltransferase [Infirmifilum uzonense]AKG38923.1 tRNA (cytidine(56)-2'-O)-methyltransferase [Infirmifilum uzonense]
MNLRRIYVLRIGHRPVRDHRVTTHVGLVARAFGADGLFLEEKVEDSVVQTIRKVCYTWGGDFKVEKLKDPINFVREWKNKGIVVHLTMYGLNIADESMLNLIKSSERDILVVVGGEKVPRILYDLADYNIAIGNQPHSEVAALAIFLDRFFDGRELLRNFPGARVRIIPSSRGKKIQRVM